MGYNMQASAYQPQSAQQQQQVGQAAAVAGQQYQMAGVHGVAPKQQQGGYEGPTSTIYTYGGGNPVGAAATYAAASPSNQAQQQQQQGAPTMVPVQSPPGMYGAPATMAMAYATAQQQPQGPHQAQLAHHAPNLHLQQQQQQQQSVMQHQLAPIPTGAPSPAMPTIMTSQGPVTLLQPLVRGSPVGPITIAPRMEPGPYAPPAPLIYGLPPHLLMAYQYVGMAPGVSEDAYNGYTAAAQHHAVMAALQQPISIVTSPVA